MRTYIKSLLAVSALVLIIPSCSTAPKGDEAVVSEAQEVDSASGREYQLDTLSSKVGFTGNGVGKNHPGSFQLASGHITVANGVITGGDFVIDATSLELDQKDEMFQTKLKGHLLGADFFDVAKFPTFHFAVTGASPYTPTATDSSVVEGANFTISGNLTLKGVTKNVTFPAKVVLGENSFEAIANFNIDRTQWGILYGNDKSLKDKFISETVNIALDLKGK